MNLQGFRIPDCLRTLPSDFMGYISDSTPANYLADYFRLL
jgi:hypothetical protein